MATESHVINEFSSAVFATAGGFLVGAILKIINKVVDRRKDNLQEHLELRKELREELDTVKEELHQIQAELDEWKQKYYAQVELTNALKMDIIRLTDELEEYKTMTGMYPVKSEDDVHPSDKE